MEHQVIISSFVLLPLVAFVVSLLIPEGQEKSFSGLAFGTVSLQLLGITGYILYWAIGGMIPVNIRELEIYTNSNYLFLLDFYFDTITAVYLWVGAFTSLLIIRYSRFYMHLEEGYKRFFNTLLFFYLAYNLTVLAGNFETLFLGWEMLGISSFLLIAFYRDRYLPVRNAVKVFSIYRIGDIGIILVMWASHHLWNENINFIKLLDEELVSEQLASHGGIGLFIAICLWIAAAAKSAQFPFSSWLPRAMEGPTPSSAIFYGSLSVHFGVFLLLRTFPFWEHQWIARVLIGILGLVTALTAYLIARVQSTIKTQIAYASIAQIGIMFIEVALGLQTLALIHFAGNAFLRTYQLLVSPSVVAYLIRDQFYHFKPREISLKNTIPKRLEYSLYILSLKEWNLDRMLNRLVFNPIKKLGRKLDFLTPKNLFLYFVPLYALGLFLYFNQEWIPELIRNYLAGFFGLLGLMMVFKAFSERIYPRLALMLVMANHFWIALAVSFNESFDYSQILIYLSGVVVPGIIGYWALDSLRKKEKDYFDLNQYYGHVYEHPKLALIFLLASLGVMGFPITPTFIGVDLIFSHIHEDQYVLAAFDGISFIFGGIALIRIYARLFLGPHIKNYHSTALKSS
ncbi:proton-conducting transporter transmembrane domain-containing protein [Algoriphagus persicinus]|uniref:proton-conducting transporter transmembrane domain-containing protein n=1 Tax=Algoriphagus persicinus TaxID=3108754 RepID=UPI002B3EAC63|nr:proton-conducting transporter membrane subunit [Algoriphagus sp. E1-3-M2]MEB2784944.1 proton-conducting transporter membrane subunit [Algoriphagus sp. E1-3-M2]